jgi:hypothetical protein
MFFIGGDYVTSCKDCNFKIGKKCWYYGEITQAQLSEKVLIGCEHYHPWWTMHPPQSCDRFQTLDRLMSESVTINENGQMISGWIQEHKALAHCMSILFHDDR